MTVQATVVALFVVAVVAVVLITATVIARFERRRRSRVLARLTTPHRMLLLDVASGEDDGSSAEALIALRGRTWEGLRAPVTTLLSKVRGAPADQLVAVLAAHGEIDRARAGTTSRSATRRARSAHLLGVARVREAVPDLLPMLHDRSPEVRLVAARALGQIADPVAAEALLRAVVPPQHRRGMPVGVPAWIVADGLLAMGPSVSAVVGAGLADADPLVRGVAASVMAHTTFPALLPVLRRRLLEETEPTVHATLAAALGHLGAEEDVELLTDHTSAAIAPELRRACVSALGALGDTSAEPRLVELLADDDRRLSLVAADALVDLGPVGRRALESAAAAQGEAAARAARGALELAELRGRR